MQHFICCFDNFYQSFVVLKHFTVPHKLGPLLDNNPISFRSVFSEKLCHFSYRAFGLQANAGGTAPGYAIDYKFGFDFSF